ncbi:DUF5134 domain-containing protein [Streptomyces sp. NPDC007164]|uniref:DUF5134 domain-containing protein n=1 Tax=Streptomyces sp. NPDC007164 TaxID=3156918 RepID=UPI0033FA1D58
MSSTDTVYALLTTLLTGAALYAVHHALAPDGPAWRGRVDHLLHAATAGDAVGPSLPQTAQTLLYSVAAVWFTLVPACRPGESRPDATARRLPSALGMAAMVWMLRTPHGTHHAPAVAAPHSGSPVTAAPAGGGCGTRPTSRRASAAAHDDRAGSVRTGAL